MTTAEDGAALSVFREIVDELYPEEREIVPVLWAWWKLTGSDVARTTRPSPAVVPATGKGKMPRSTFVLLILVAVLDCDSDSVSVTDEQLRRAARGAAAGFDAPEAEIEAIINATVPRVRNLVTTLTAPGELKRHLRAEVGTETTEFFVESSTEESHTVPAGEIDGLKSAASVDLIVDEREERLIGRLQTRSFSHLDGRALSTVWLALVHTGGSFGYEEIGSVARVGFEIESAARHYPTTARKLFQELIGRDLIPRAKRGRYHIPRDTWSWLWIRSAESRTDSRLIAD